MKHRFSEHRFLGTVILVGIVSTFAVLASYGYLGTFSRYASDDYCLSAFYFQEGDFFTRMIQRYINNSSRYTNILFIGFVDKVFGWYNVAVLPPLMLSLFVFGLYLLLKEIAQIASLGWNHRLSLYSASLIVYFSLIQAPDLYETLYWRAGMTSHFAPHVIIPFLCTYLLRQIRIAGESVPSLWVRIASLLSLFMLGGLSEPPIALMVTILTLVVFSVWWRRDILYRRSALAILPWALAGALLALITLALAPANSNRLGDSAPGLIGLISRILRYPLVFILDDLQKFPLPTLISIILPGLLFHLHYAYSSQTLSSNTRVRLAFLFVITALIAYLLIAASFAPSVYGQNYPIARARFGGRVLLTCALMMEGAILGILLSTVKTKTSRLAALRPVGIIVLMLLSLYPLRSVPRVSAEIPIYQQRAEAWDQRDAQISALKAEGVQDLLVPRLPLEVMQDLHNRTGFRLNRCASMIYGVHSILAIRIPK